MYYYCTEFFRLLKFPFLFLYIFSPPPMLVFCQKCLCGGLQYTSSFTSISELQVYIPYFQPFSPSRIPIPPSYFFCSVYLAKRQPCSQFFVSSSARQEKKRRSFQGKAGVSQVCLHFYLLISHSLQNGCG